MQTLTPPTMMTRRSMASDLVAGLPDGFIDDLLVQLPHGYLSTVSFMDELVYRTLAEGRVGTLIVSGTDEYGREMLTSAANGYGVLNHLRFGLLS
jgi:hypothetical protein